MTKSKMKQAMVLALLMLLVGGCAGKRAFVAGRDLMQAGKYDEAVAAYFRAASKEPENKEYRMRLIEARSLAAQSHLKQGRLAASREDYRMAAAEFEQAAALDPSADVALNELKGVKERLRAEDLAGMAEQFYRTRKFSQAREAATEALQLRPGYEPARVLLEKVQGEGKSLADGFELDLASDRPITLKFKDADVREVFNILAKLSGINFIYDEEIRSQRVSVLLEDASFAQALELLLNMNKLGKKVLNPKTIIVYPKTKEKEKQYEDQLIQTFYLSNIDAKKAVNMLRTMLQLRKIYVHEELNALVIRDTPEVIKLARQIIEAADRGDSEVLFDLELIEVNHTNRLEIGPRLSSNSVSLGLGKVASESTASGTVVAGKIVSDTLAPGTLTANLVSSFSSLESFYTLPTATFDLLKTRSDAEVLANPKIRVKNKEKAKVLVGTREPVITVTQNNDIVTDNVQYVDVGVKLDVEPTIQLDDSVITKLNLEVSSVSGRQTTTSGTQVLTITTTNAQTGLTLKDGERTIIGGLIRDDTSNSRRSIPLIGDLPIIGNLLTNRVQDKTKREILLSITPHIVKSVDMPHSDVASIWSGGEDDLKAGPNFGAFAVPVEKAAAGPEVPAAPAPQAPPPSPPEAGMPEPLPSSEAPPAAAEEVAPAVAPPGIPVPLEATPVRPPEALGQAALPSGAVLPEGSRVFLSGPAQVKVGEEFTVEALAEGMRNLYSAPLFVNYDPQLLEFVRAEEGGFLRQQGQATVFTSSANPAAGKLIIGYKQGEGGAGASGSGSLFRLVFRARAAGSAAPTLDRINFRDPAGKRLPVTATGLTVEVR